ncbi:Alpha/beta hydrolase family protein [Rosistilla ulvae]|uniref:Alpha/beta hydrolase family protein n=1 Tax=Rosistilla ulvae TaxID=1930277 RepID=A0A517M5H7_9BACT|nr:acetylxylan esterase [Rosistilla ulvae]QDS90123.1 Alpha/beta hydrolase family protein [Rosistilla ulvae]
MSSPNPRRQFLQSSAAGALGALIAQQWWASGAMGQSEPAAMTPLNRFPRMIQEYYVDRMRKFHDKRVARLDAIETQADAEAYVKSCQTRVRECFGPRPEKTPLNPQITGVVQREGYRIENLIFESRPGFLVTANLYIPTHVEGPRPAVVGTCGHSHNGKAEEAYQSFSQGLAKKGYVCLIYDPIGQGERLQYVDEHLKSHVGVGVREHLLAGNQQFLTGESFSMWRAWDGIRAFDYLLTRPEVDPAQIGVTGNSGGGTMTTLLAGVDQRWAMAAPSCYVTSFVRNLENELPTDTEQCPPNALALGLDHEDFLAALAPKPVIILAKEQDFFDVRGAEQAYERLKRLYSKLGKEENIGLFVGPTRHGFTLENREAMYGWFNRATGSDGDPAEPEMTIEDDKTLWCTPDGQVSELGSKTVQQFTREAAAKLAESRGEIGAKPLKKMVHDWLGDRKPLDDSHYRILRNRRDRKYPRKYVAAYVIETEPRVQALVYRIDNDWHFSRPPKDKRQAILYVSHHSSDAELRENELLGKAIAENPDTPVFTVDLRGMGESQPDTADVNSYLSAYGSDYMYAIHGVMFRDEYPRQRTFDLLTVLNWLQSFGHDGVHLIGNGWGAIPATFAAVLSPVVKQVTLQHALTSYTDLASAETYKWPLSSMVPGILQRFDLPDCYRYLESKQLKQIDPWGPNFDDPHDEPS